MTEATEFSANEGLIGRALADMEPRWIADINKDKDYTRASVSRALPIKSAFFFPFVAGQSVVAVLEFYALETIELDQKSLAVIS